MAFVGPVAFPQGYRPVGVFCEVCNTNLLTWRCYACGGLYCGRCIFAHNDVPQVLPEDTAADGTFANDVAEGMHALWRSYFDRLGSEMASDLAGINDKYTRFYHCCH